MTFRSIILFALILLPVAALAQTEAGSIPVGTPLAIAIDQHYPMRAGAEVRGNLLYPIYSHNKLLLPKGTVVTGMVDKFVSDRHRRVNAVMGGDFTPFHTPVVHFTDIVLPGGTTIPFSSGAASTGTQIYRAVAPPPAKGSLISREFKSGLSAARGDVAYLSLIHIYMTYHGGKIMPTAVVEPIFWGTSWGSYSGDKMTGIDAYYTGFSGSNYAKTTDEYTGTNGQVGPTLSLSPHTIDVSAATGGNNTSAILAEVCKKITPDRSGNGYYPVYTDVPRGNAGYCAWHSAGTCGGVPVQFAFFFKLDGDAGCDPQDTAGLHSQGLSAIANVSGHELSEARSDPASPGAWYDASGEENGDKCAWTFGAPLVSFTNGTQWKIQGEWSNNAYTAGTGYANSSGQKGCLSGL